LPGTGAVGAYVGAPLRHSDGTVYGAIFGLASKPDTTLDERDVRFLEMLSELRQLKVFSVTAQGLPGIIGRDGWLARSPVTQGTFICTLPGLTTAMRLDVHFWWNTIEMLLLLCAGSVFLRGRLPALKS